MNTSTLFPFLQQNALLVSLLVISGIGLAWPGLRRSSGGGDPASPHEATLLINRENARIVDVSDAEEYANGHLPNAIHIPLNALGERIKEIEKFKEKTLILVCASGNRSAKACSELKKLGFSRLYNLTGGVNAWREAGLPLKKDGA